MLELNWSTETKKRAPPSEEAGTDSEGTMRGCVRAKTEMLKSTNLLAAYPTRTVTKPLEMLGVREAAIAICDAEPDILRKDAEEQGTHVMVGVAAVDDKT